MKLPGAYEGWYLGCTRTHFYELAMDLKTVLNYDCVVFDAAGARAGKVATTYFLVRGENKYAVAERHGSHCVLIPSIEDLEGFFNRPMPVDNSPVLFVPHFPRKANERSDVVLTAYELERNNNAREVSGTIDALLSGFERQTPNGPRIVVVDGGYYELRYRMQVKLDGVRMLESLLRRL